MENNHMQISSRRAKGTAVAVGLGAVLAAASLTPANAASHREAPLISMDPAADNTDTYAFVSPDDDNKVTLIANFIPFQDPFAGPNFFRFGDDVLYSIHVDNDGDAVPNITYEYRFTTVNEEPGIPVYTSDRITDIDDPFNQKQTYSLSRVEDGVRTELAADLPVPPANAGFRTLPDYESVANQAIVDVAGVTTFAGQRDEHFGVDLGSIFDLGGLRPFGEAHLVPLAAQEGVNSNDGKNVHSIAIEVPIADLTQDDDVIGVWSTASRKKVRVFAQNSGANPVNRGRWVQVSRLGNPLVNEVVIPIELKDTFNTLRPDQDADVLAGLQVEPFATEGDIPLVTDPILADLIEVLYPGVETPPDGSRSDLVAIFLTGIDQATADALGVPVTAQQGGVPAEMLRLNTSIKPDPETQSDLGVLGGDPQGFPNGRRLGDDVIDIGLRAVAGGTPFTPDFNVAPNNQLGDGVSGNDQPENPSFPYNSAPHSGYDTGPLDNNIEGNGVDDNGENAAD
jgi:hypothetical protein